MMFASVVERNTRFAQNELVERPCRFESCRWYWNLDTCECNSAVESRFSKPMVVGSNPIIRLHA